MRKSSNKTRIVAIVSLVLLIALTTPTIKAQTVTITAGPDPLMPGDPVTVEGTGFAASSAVAIGIGEEVTVTGEVHNIPEPAGYGPFTAIVNHYPIKPGSFSFHCDVSDVTSDYYDTYANGTLATTSQYAVDPFVNYVTGEFGRSSISSWETYTVEFTATYTYYQFNVTPAAGVSTDVSGAFTANITVPDIWNGTEPVTVIDDQGNVATSDFTIYGSDVVPEPLTIAAIVLLSSAALVISFYWLRKRPYTKSAP